MVKLINSCDYCKKEIGSGTLAYEDHCLLACPQKCRDYEEMVDNLKVEVKRLQSKLDTIEGISFLKGID